MRIAKNRDVFPGRSAGDLLHGGPFLPQRVQGVVVGRIARRASLRLCDALAASAASTFRGGYSSQRRVAIPDPRSLVCCCAVLSAHRDRRSVSDVPRSKASMSAPRVLWRAVRPPPELWTAIRSLRSLERLGGSSRPNGGDLAHGRRRVPAPSSTRSPASLAGCLAWCRAAARTTEFWAFKVGTSQAACWRGQICPEGVFVSAACASVVGPAAVGPARAALCCAGRFAIWGWV